MTYSSRATDRNYFIGLLTADADLLDAAFWTKSKEPALKSCVETSQYGPGHNSFTTAPGGKQVINAYHARNYLFRNAVAGNALCNHDRATRAQKLNWNKDGCPNFGSLANDGQYSLKRRKVNELNNDFNSEYSRNGIGRNGGIDADHQNQRGCGQIEPDPLRAYDRRD